MEYIFFEIGTFADMSILKQHNAGVHSENYFHNYTSVAFENNLLKRIRTYDV